MPDFQKALEQLINQYSQENGSNTPDFILAKYLTGCLENFNTIVVERERWHGRDPEFVEGEAPIHPEKSSNVQLSDGPSGSCEVVEDFVIQSMKLDSNYPFGEVDARKWAIAWRLTRDRNGIDANRPQDDTDIDGWMTSWFANCMASAHPSMIMQRGDDEYAKSIC